MNNNNNKHKLEGLKFNPILFYYRQFSFLYTREKFHGFFSKKLCVIPIIYALTVKNLTKARSTINKYIECNAKGL